MSGQAKESRRKAHRVVTWTCVTLVPALAIMALGTGLLPVLASSAPADVPSGLLVAETRAFAAQGDDLSAVTAAAKPADGESLDQFVDSWQNTVRRRPSPRRKSEGRRQ